MEVHAETRKRGLVDALHSLGLCISYDRTLAISTDVANSVCARFESEGVVCPPPAVTGVFTTAAVDNIDHNPSSTTSQGSSHGTAISLLQHPTQQFPGTLRVVTVIDNNLQGQRAVSPLPDAYTLVNPVALPYPDPLVPPVPASVQLQPPTELNQLNSVSSWLIDTKDTLLKPELQENDIVSWAAYNSSQHEEHTVPVTPAYLLPLFPEAAHSVAMIFHAMNVVKAVVTHLNPGQIPGLVADQPLFLIAKKIQWNYPQIFGEEQFVVFLGGMHVEMTAFRLLGNWLDSSGWTTAIINSGVAAGGTADSLLAVSHLGKTKYAHEVTAAALFVLMDRAYREYISSTPVDEVKEISAWCEDQMAEHPQFQYWSMVLNLEILVLNLVGSIRSGDFQQYMKSIQDLIPWSFAMDHINYSRSLSINLRDMTLLSTLHPSVYTHFSEGRFVAHRTTRSFSGMALDQAHEQLNALVKGEGGAVGLTENAAALRRWMVAGPEISRMVQEFEGFSQRPESEHHTKSHSTQISFKQDVGNLIDAIHDLGNPFLEDSGDLITLDTKDIMEQDSIASVKNAYMLGREQYALFVRERFEEQLKTISNPLKKNKLPLFSKKKNLTKVDHQVAALKEDRSLFGHLYIASQNRDGDLQNFFKHENQPWPPSLSQYGELRSGTKSDLLQCLEELSTPPRESPHVIVAVLDGAFIVQMLGTGTSTTFQEYVDTFFMPYIRRKLMAVHQVDIVWDVYKSSSLKSGTRTKRGSGLRWRVTLSTTIPGNWQSFLRVNENKTELFALLAEQIALMHVDGKEVYSTQDKRVLCSPIRADLSTMFSRRS